MQVKLGDLLAFSRFPDGISASHYKRVARCIGAHGPNAWVELRANDHESLEDAIRLAEKGKVS